MYAYTLPMKHEQNICAHICTNNKCSFIIQNT